MGTGGLVHAYGASAKQGLLESGIITRTLCNIVDFRVDYTLVGKVQYYIQTNNFILEDTIYDNEVTFKICSKIEDTERLIADLIDLTNGKVTYEISKEPKYIDVK